MILKWYNIQGKYYAHKCIRRLLSKKASVGKTKKPKKYSSTLNLPKTTFPLSMKDDIARRETDIQKVCEFDKLYEWQRNQPRQQQFVLHDGPPYANGDPHVGHALNKILKDITTRYKVLQGYKVHYVPGWDCHGLPIERKALEEIQADHTSMQPQDIRHRARKFAERTIQHQMRAFKRWGVMADWNNAYYTYDKEFEVSQLETFYQMYEKGLIYQDYMPVYWSPSSRTALAEAELEYNDQHISPAVYVKFPIVQLPESLSSYLDASANVFALFWTTTPWTLPANEAICYGNNIKYSLVKSPDSDDILLVAAEVVDKLAQLFSCTFETLCTITGEELKNCKYVHPMNGRTLPLLPGHHVTVEKGTGLVHVAPAHGPEDFQVAVNHDIPVECRVNEAGRYTAEFGSDLADKAVLEEGNDIVLQKLKDSIIHHERFTHSYPYDWRSKQPVIIRASKQWFVSTKQVKDKALEALENVEILPKSSEQGMLSQLGMRTYWCISRQRAWGVPIPVFYHAETGKPLLDRHSIDNVKQLVGDHGTDCWWSHDIDTLLPSHVRRKAGYSEDDVFTKGEDVLDIWFDSGSTWSHVLKDCGGVADVYLEGLDQFGGWFQSSLLTSVAVQDKAPYKNLVVHGFAVDEEGKKMSKSVGNVIDPWHITDGNKNKKDQTVYGADVLRWWAALAHLDTKVNIGKSVLSKSHEQIFKTRKSLRYLLGNLHDFEPEEHKVDYDNLPIQDRYMLHILNGFMIQVTKAYSEFNYSKVVQLLEKFINVQVSAFYCHTTKDRMYCSMAESTDRRSGQTVQYYMLTALTGLMAPVLPHLAEEIHQQHPFNMENGSIFKTPLLRAAGNWHNPPLEYLMMTIQSMRDTFYQVIGSENPAEFDLVICAKWRLFTQIKKLQPDDLTSSVSPLTEMLGSSTTSLLSRLPLVIPDEAQPVECSCRIKHLDGTEEDVKYLMLILPAENYQCERCRRYTTEKRGQLCTRCSEILVHGWD